MWPFKTEKKINPLTVNTSTDLLGIRMQEVANKFPLGSHYLYHDQPVAVIDHHKVHYYLHHADKIPGVWIEWFDTNKHLITLFIDYERLRFLTVDTTKLTHKGA